MPKVQDVFSRPDGTKVMDTPYTMRIVEIPAEPRVADIKGKKVEFYDLKLEHQGQILEWSLTLDQINRILIKKAKDTGAIIWEAKVDDVINVTYCTPKGSGFPYFDAALAEEGDNFVTEVNISEGAKTENRAFHAAKRGVQKAGSERFDDAPQRVGNFRAGLCAFTCAILANPQVDPKDPQQVEAAMKLAAELVIRGRQIGAQLAEQFPND